MLLIKKEEATINRLKDVLLMVKQENEKIRKIPEQMMNCQRKFIKLFEKVTKQ